VESRKNSYGILTFLVFGIMLVLGFIENIRGALVPSIRTDFNVDYTSIGNMLLVSGLGYIATTLIGGIVAEKYGQRLVVGAGMLCIAVSVLGISYSYNYIVFLIFMFILNFGFGAVAIGANTLAPAIFLKKQALMMNLMHFFYGVGAILGPGYAGKLLNYRIAWRNIYLYSLLGVIFIAIIFKASRFPVVKKVQDQNKRTFSSVVKDKRIVLFSIGLGFYVACEVGIASWLPNFLMEVHGFDKFSSSLYLSWFFLLFTLGRLFGGFIVERLGYIRATLSFMILALSIFSAGLLLGNQYVFLISLSGLFFSITFPTVIAILMGEYKQGTSSVIGFAVTIASTINMIGNWTMGKVSDIGVSFGFSLIIVYFIIAIALIFTATKMKKAY
jgi:fucose permease